MVYVVTPFPKNIRTIRDLRPIRNSRCHSDPAGRVSSVCDIDAVNTQAALAIQ